MTARTDASELLNRLDRLPIWPYPRKLLLVIGVGFFFSFFDIITIGMALPDIAQQFHITVGMATWAVTSSLIGYIMGSLLDSRLSDLFGRKLALYLSIAFFSIGSILSATTTDINSLIFWRFIIGMGVGSEIVNISTYMAEVAPAPIRGKVTCWAIAAGMLGFAVVPFVALALVPHFALGWRALFVMGGAGGVVIFFMRRHLPDSPRWLITQDRVLEAEATIVTAEAYVKAHYKGVLPVIPVSVTLPLAQLSLWAALVAYRRRIMLFAILWCVYYIGNYAWLTLATDLFVQHGINLGQSILFVAIASLGFIFGSLIAVTVSDKFERKQLIFGVLIIWSLALLMIAWLPNTTTISVFGFIASTSIAVVIPILYTYTAENFPTAQRATCISVTDGFGHLGGAFCGQIILGVYGWFSHTPYAFAAAFSAMAVTGLVAAVLSLLGAKMTRRQVA